MMFLSLLLVTFLVALLVSFVVAHLFDRPIRSILDRIVSEELSQAWHRYVKFAVYVVGISGGVRVHQLERYIIPSGMVEGSGETAEALMLTSERWILELYRTVIGTLQGIAWMFLLVFVVALLAYVLTRGYELKHGKPGGGDSAL